MSRTAQRSAPWLCKSTIGGVAVHFAENLLDDFHVLAGQGKLLLLAELEQLVAAQVSHGNGAVGFGGHIAGKK
jgi:hypothetical protein